MLTILKGFAVIMVISLLTFLFIKMFSVKVLVGLFIFVLLVEDVRD